MSAPGTPDRRPSKGITFVPPERLPEAEDDSPSGKADYKYRRTLRFAVSVAAQLVFPNQHIRGGHPVGKGYYFEVSGANLTKEEVQKIGDQLQELIASKEAITVKKKTWKEVHEYCKEHGLVYTQRLMETRVREEVDCLECRGVLRMKLYNMLSNLGPLADPKCSLIYQAPGFFAVYSESYEHQPSIETAYLDHIRFARSHEIECVGALNGLGATGRVRKDYILDCEFRQGSKISMIGNRVQERQAEGRDVKLICIAGPTSSGKTTFATKLCMYLKNLGFNAKVLTVDHYYLPLDRQPKYQARCLRSDVDYDHIESMDVDLVGEHLNALVQGKKVETPKYNMKTGYRDEPGMEFGPLPSNGILVIEGIHALNPLYTKAVDANKVYKVFISPLNALQLDDFNVVKSTDHRLMRRMCRDYLFRGNSASTTLKMWPNVRKGEKLWIFPHQNQVDFVLNSAADYEIPVLKTMIEGLLRAVTPEDEFYGKAVDLLRLLDCFNSWPPHCAPPAALLREFIGEGAFDCH